MLRSRSNGVFITVDEKNVFKTLDINELLKPKFINTHLEKRRKHCVIEQDLFMLPTMAKE